MREDSRPLAVCAVTVIAALLVVGAVSHGVLRHIVQTFPLWIGIVLTARQSGYGKWAVLPCFIFWLLVMIAIWLFLLGWAQVVSGTFSPTEIAMTLIVGTASSVGIVKALRLRGAARPWAAAVTSLGVAMLQLAMFRLSLIDSIAHR